MKNKSYDRFSLRPASRFFGFDRGLPVDRYYIEKFLRENKAVIRGEVLEVGDNAYTMKYGGNKVTNSQVLNLTPATGATIVGNLATGENIPRDAFDCIILTQVLHLIFDCKAALKYAFLALKKQGVLLLTVPGISQSCQTKEYGDHWRFTTQSLTTLLAELEDVENFFVQAHGNLAVTKAFLDGLALHELPKGILDKHDGSYQMLITAAIERVAER